MNRSVVPPAELEARLKARVAETRAQPERSVSPMAIHRVVRSKATALVAALVLLIFGAVTALAVHDLGLFELDRNATPGLTPGDDWGTLYGGGGSAADFTGIIEDTVASNPLGSTGTQFQAGGSKDDLDLSPGGATGQYWKWDPGEPLDKDDITNAYAAAYINALDSGDNNIGDLIVYFGLDRFANNGSAQVGFWFLQDPTFGLTTTSSGGGYLFSGHHQPHDILVQSNFSQGGVISNISVFEWVGSGGSSGTLDLLFETSDCLPALAGDDPACATVNQVDETSPWPFTPKFGTSGIFPAGSFFEGGINISRLVPDAGCFTGFLAETRSSTPFDSRLKDFAFGDFNLCGSKSGTKFQDDNADGIFGATESGLSGWTINLYKDVNSNQELDATDLVTTDNDPFAATTTADGTGTLGLGDYLFTDLEPGDYIVCEASQTDWFQSLPNSGTTEMTDTCDEVATNAEFGYAFHIDFAEDETGNDFGNWQQGTKSGTKYEDPNADGDLSDGTGLENWTINVYADDGDGVLSATEYGAGPAGSDVTDTNGDYTVDGLDPGDYIACEVAQTDWFQSYPTSGADCTGSSGATDLGDVGWAFTLTSGQDETGNDFGNWTTATKSGTKFEDLDADGAARETGEPGLAGWTIYVDYNDNGTFDAATEPSDVTDADGNYQITGILPGSYKVREVGQSGWTCSYPNNGTTDLASSPVTSTACYHDETFSSGADLTGNDFGNWTTATKSGTKFEDLDADGAARETGEPGLAGWTIYVDYNDNGTFDAATEPSDVTDADGNYQITGILPGSYKVREVGQSGWTCSYPNNGTTDLASSPVTSTACYHDETFSSGADLTGNDFGNWTTATKSGTKFEDLDADGAARETGEPGLAGWTIYVDYNDNGTFDAATEPSDVTDADGNYQITGILPGSYKVREVGQSGWTCSYPNNGTTDLASSPVTSTACYHDETFSSGADLTGNDFGNWTTATKSGTKYEDPNADGDLSDGTGLENWTINVYADDGDGVLSATEYGAGPAGSDVTDTNGDYTVDGLDPGDYIACEVAQTDWFQSYPTSGADCTGSSGATDLGDVGWAFTLTSGQDETGNDFGNWTTATKSGTKYEDPNADGDLSDGTGLENWTINVYADDGDGVLSATEYGAGPAGSDVTDTNGDYTVDGLDPGDYIACEVAQTDWFQSYPTSGADCTGSSGATDLGDVGWAFTLTSGQDETGNDFGNWTTATKTGTKYEDPNADGDLSDGTGLENWTINVYADDGDGVLSATEYGAGPAGSDVTDTNGDYTVDGLDPGDYIACEVAQTDWFQSYPTSGADCTGSSGATDLGDVGWAFTLTSGQDETGNDFGNWTTATKSGTKFNDANNNGIWDSGELGLAGWTIKVFDDADASGTLTAGDTEVTSTTTADGSGALALGEYEFTLDPGDYLVCEVSQATWTQTYPANSVCDNAAVDATVAPGGYAITLTSGQVDAGNNFGNFVFIPPMEGCTPGFWQGGVGLYLWDEAPIDPDWLAASGDALGNPFTTTDLFTSFFPPSLDPTVDAMTMVDIVGTGGTSNWARKAARDLIAAYLNASFGIDYPYSTSEILADWSTAVSGGTNGFKVFHTQYDTANNLGCPL